MLCYRCGSHVADTVDTCPTCGQKLAGGGLRQATGTFSRRRATSQVIEGAPYRPQDLVANRYLIKDIIGAGPLGFVFRAHDKEVDVEVALKVVNARLCQTADERRTFAKQLRLARKLSHPNLVRVYEEGEDQDRPFFTSQFLDGLTLRKIIDLRLQKGQFFALHEIEPILSQVCSALDGAHKVGPHTSIKPDNVLVLPDLLKVTDFGLGLALPRLPYVQAMKSRKADRYLSPEMVDGGEVDGRTDVYSVGVILGEMLSGLTPDGSVPELHRRNPNVPQAIEGLYRKAVNSNPNARFKTAGELFAEFTSLAKASAPPPPLPAKPEPATGAPPPLRPRTTTGMLQLQPRRDKPPPPVPSMSLPPPPPPTSGESLLPDATQPVDPERLEAALKGPGPTPDNPENREETAVIDSGQVLASLDPDDHAETRAQVETVPPPPEAIEPASEGKTWLLVLLLVVLGVGLGAGGGFYLIQRQKAATEEQKRLADEARQRDEAARREAELRAAQASAAGGVAQPDAPPTVTPAVDAAAAERAAAEKLAAEKAAAEKAAADKAAAEKAAAEKAAADKAAMDKASAAEKLAAEKAEKERLAAEKAAADKAEKERLAAEKAAADKAEKERLAAEKAAADKAAKEKAAAGNAATPVKPAAADGCPEGMRAVSAGVFRMGTSRDDPMMGFDEKVLTAMEVPAFCIDAFEYPNKKGAAPMVSVSFQDAKRLCEAQGKRLCSEPEWEKACKGPGSAKWPFGNAFDANACNTEDDAGEARSLAPAGRFGKCRSGYGTADQSGNVAEWTSDRIIKGGSYASGDYAVRCAARKPGANFNKSGEVGFRCCADTK
ncbi:MAG: bifunctional serine/threonine-protein kinase/formylglycine-generating enzyme family protein [Myxococcaceae bacterium]|nr:bifunctional serine/threonine-protein kinase/formylglycine-generating enzyme family protein [Myxococcaceae bacterium]